MKNFAITSLILIISLISCEKENQTKYPDNNLPGIDSSEIFAEGLISVADRYEFGISFSSNGSKILFSCQNESNSQSYLLFSELKEGTWTNPDTIVLAKGRYPYEMEAFFSPLNDYVYFTVIDSLGPKILRIRQDKLFTGGYEEVDTSLTRIPAFYSTTSLFGRTYFSNLAEGGKIFSFGFSEKGFQLKNEQVEYSGHPFIAPDESFLLIDARLTDDRQRDICIVFKDDNGHWTKPVPLGSEVNTTFSETCPSLSSDGKYLFFSRYNELNEKSNIYWISSEILYKLKPI